MKIDGGFEVVYVAEPTRHLFDLLNLAIDAFGRGVGYPIFKVVHNPCDMILYCFRPFMHDFQPTVCRPKIPPLPEFPRHRLRHIAP